EKVVQPLIDALSDADENVRYWSAKALAKIGDEQAILKLRQSLSSPEWIVRKAASDALIEIGPPALKYLYEILERSGEDARFWAVKTVGKIGDQSSTPVLMPFLADKNQDVQTAAVEALGNISDSRAINPLISLLQSDENHLKHHIKEALCKIGDKCIAHLIKVLSSSNWSARRTASLVLGDIGGRSIEFLMSELKKHKAAEAADAVTLNDDAVYWIIEALGEIGDKVVTLSLMDFLKHKKTEIKISAIRALGKIKDERALAPLIDLLEENDDMAADVLIKAIAGFKEAAVNALVKNLGSPKWQVRSNAAAALEKIGVSVAGRMIELLDCKNRDVSHWAAEVISRFDKYLEDDLIDLLENGNYDQRFYASKILGRIKSEKAIAGLINGLQDEYWTVRKNSAFSLGELKSKDAIAPLVRALKDEDEDLRSEVCLALSKMGYVQVGKYLSPYIDDEFTNVRIAAIDAVGAIGYKEALPAVAARINDDNIYVRMAAIKAVGRLKGEACVNLLLAQMNNSELRSHVISALGEIGAVSNIKHLTSVLAKSGDRDERALAASVLFNFDQREVIKALSDALSDDYYMVRKNAALSLTLINERRRGSEKEKNGQAAIGSEAESLYSLGMAFLNAKKYSDAVVAFQKSLSLSPKNYNTLIKLGIAYENKDMLNEAIECFNKCAASEPNRPESYIYLAVALSSVKKYEESLINLKRAEECAKNARTLEIVKKLIKKVKTLMYSY
ncbi:MAG TPA: HEAT repeat domain-containing protein, partial [Candidatus Wallbacteria bacterium]|nr:HEAT repeat domain-containing protein [Candidatus Wallbacteria bacterium]